jgi:phosphosulfolactate synthase
MTKPFSHIPLPAERSRTKPRRKGLTMMMDWGLPFGQQEDWLDLLAPVVDLAKLVVGTARLYEEDYLRRKLDLYAVHGVRPFLGGQFMEYVFSTQGMDGVKPFCDEAVRLGIHAIEVSDNVVTLDDDERRAIIGTAVECGLEVHGEVGSKSEDSGAETLIAQARVCFDAGADVVLVEGAELLRDGVPNQSLTDGLRADLDTDRVIFELSGYWVPGTHHTDNYRLKVFLVRTFGPDVNLANVMPADVWETEALRCGLSIPGPMGPGVSD